MNLTLIAAALFALAAGADLTTTAIFLKKKTAVEGDPIAVLLYGSNNPTPLRAVLTGAVEIALVEAALIIAHYHYHMGSVLPIIALGGAAAHTWAAWHNRKFI